ncbi:hypothetical protein JW710_02005 [Candidatus Dojkabacteria bacterium]|nr:hypothetical protein [Candidatus Dojkabacteria bacterium]
MQYQTATSLQDVLERLLSSNPNRSFSGVFKALRKEKRISLIGDYALLYFILHYGYHRTPRYTWNRNQVMRGIRISGFYKDIPRKTAYIPPEWKEFIDGI